VPEGVEGFEQDPLTKILLEPVTRKLTIALDAWNIDRSLHDTMMGNFISQVHWIVSDIIASFQQPSPLSIRAPDPRPELLQQSIDFVGKLSRRESNVNELPFITWQLVRDLCNSIRKLGDSGVEENCGAMYDASAMSLLETKGTNDSGDGQAGPFC